MSGTNSKRRFFQRNREREVIRICEDGTNEAQIDTATLIEAMLVNFEDVYAQVLGGHDVDAEDTKSRLFYVYGAIAGMTNLLATCNAIDRETARDVQDALSEVIDAHRR